MQYFIYRFRVYIFIALVIVVTGARIWYDVTKQSKPQTLQCAQVKVVEGNKVQCLRYVSPN